MKGKLKEKSVPLLVFLLTFHVVKYLTKNKFLDCYLCSEFQILSEGVLDSTNSCSLKENLVVME